jgi:uncharacterized protein YdbL (DUF1318 family)
VNDLNIRRRENYAQKAQEQGVTLQEYAMTQGCILIARTRAVRSTRRPTVAGRPAVPGPPVRDARCP